MSLTITKRDGTRVPFNADYINRSIERACYDLDDAVNMVTQIASETELTLFDGIREKEVDEATISAALQNIKEDPMYDTVAKRLLLKIAYIDVLGDFSKEDREAPQKLHVAQFPEHIRTLIEDGRLDSKMQDRYDLEELAQALHVKRDEKFNYAGLSTLLNRYALKGDGEDTLLETPQYVFMRVAMGLSYNEENPTEAAKSFYHKMSKLEYLPGGSTFLGSGTKRASLSNCFLLEMHDNIDHIAKSVSDVIRISKMSGGIGASLTKLRASGSPLSVGGTSTGPAPFAKIIDTSIRAIQRGGKKKGACAFYMENWHLDFPEFIDWRHNAGDDYLRMRTANTACFLSDEFMKRIKEDQDWYMFDPAETPDLNELYGSAFSKRYAEYIEKADKGELRAYKKVPAKEQYRQILVSLQGTSHPWLTWKDPFNVRALNNNTGTIHMSNLCTEIALPQDADNISVCNLASVNVPQHINENNEIDWQRLEESVRMAVRHLDNLVDINKLTVEEAARSDKENRAVGMGMMGMADTFEKMGMAYDSEEAYDLADRIFEFMSYMAIDESANLAEVRGSYDNFEGSMWSKGFVPVDTLEKLEKERGMELTVDKESKHKGLDWDVLRGKVKKGMRNATLMAVAPNANIGLVGCTTPGMDPRFAQIFSRNKISGKYMDINTNLVAELKKEGIWEDVRSKIIESQGDIAHIDEIPQALRDRFKISFSVDPRAIIEVAARAQKWVDQAISRNMYLATRDNEEIMDIYSIAWEKGLKSTYYLHMKPRHTAEQSTTTVNKAQSIGKAGFGALKERLAQKKQAADLATAQPVKSPLSPEVPQNTPVVAQKEEKEKVIVEKKEVKKDNKPFVCPTDPAELAQCDSCQ